MIKRCPVCKTEKPISDFNTHPTKKFQPSCRDCNKASSRAYYLRNKKNHIKRVGERRKLEIVKNQATILSHLRLHPCVDCGESDPAVLEFDHLRDKVKNVAHMMSGSNNTLQKEMAKCAVRCANCHRRKSLKAINSYKTRT
jgi:hypothetical protein